MLRNPPFSVSPHDFSNRALSHAEEFANPRLREEWVQRSNFSDLIVRKFSHSLVIEAMPILAKILSVVPLIAQIKVSRIYATAACYVSSFVQKLAVMQNFDTGTNISKKQKPAGSVRLKHGSFKSGPDEPVPVSIESSYPYPATIGDPNLVKESLRESQIEALWQDRVLSNVAHSSIRLPVWGATQRAFLLYGA